MVLPDITEVVNGTLIVYIKNSFLKVRVAVVDFSHNYFKRGGSSRKCAFIVGEPPALMTLTKLFIDGNREFLNSSTRTIFQILIYAAAKIFLN